MPFRAPVSEYQFLFENVVDYSVLTTVEKFEHATSDIVDAILTEAGRLCEDVIAPLQRNGDTDPARLENGVVRTSKGFADGYRAIAEGGWVSTSASP
ncbi:MAG: hypothetical protein RI946_261, partial [Pseudomonadota bacterium]